MENLLMYLLFAVGVVLIVKGGDWFVDGAVWVAEVTGIPKFIIGATIISLATTLPEVIVSTIAAVEGHSILVSGVGDYIAASQGKVGMAIGNGIGSVICNTAMILAINIIFMPLAIKRREFAPKSLLLVAAVVALFACSLGGAFTTVGAAVMIFIFALYIIENIRSAKDEAAAKKVAAEINAAGGQAEGFALDIRKKETFTGVCDAILAKFGTIDFLVNNESEEIAPEDRKPLHEFDMDLYDDIITANLDGVYYFSKAAMQDMAKRKKGAVVNVMSIRGLIPVANQTPVVAAAGAQVGFTKMWGVELKDEKIRVNGVAAGIVKNEKNAAYLQTEEQVKPKLSHLAVERLATPEDIANAALFLASDEAAYITGVVLPVDGGLSAGYVRSF